MVHSTLSVPQEKGVFLRNRRTSRGAPVLFFSRPGCANDWTAEGGQFMSSRQQHVGLAILSLLLVSQIICFFLNAVDNFFATFRFSFMGHKGAALVKPVVQVKDVVLVGQTLMWFYLICCLIFFILLLGLWVRAPIFFRLLLVLDAISLALGLYGYYFWATSNVELTSTERVITLIEPLLSSGGLLLLIGIPALRHLWWKRQKQ